MAKTKVPTTYDREMKEPAFRAAFEKESAALEVSEFIAEKMAERDISVRRLAAMCRVSPTVIQGIKSGSRKDIKYNTLHQIVAALGYRVMFEKIVKHQRVAARSMAARTDGSMSPRGSSGAFRS